MANQVEQEQLRIEVRGPERTSNTFFCSLIADALKAAGVTHMEVINQRGDDINGLPTTELLAAAREHNPLLGLAGVAIFPEGPMLEEVIISDNPDQRFEDDDTGESVFGLDFAFED